MTSFMDSDSIFPKRLGIMNHNTIIIQYYHLAKDKFKKHPITFNPLTDPKNILQEIYKNPKHVAYLKKIDPNHIKSALQGKLVYEKKNQRGIQEHSNRQISSAYVYPTEPHIKVNNFVQEDIIKEESNKKIIEQKKQIQEQPDDYYNEEFQQFEISQSIEKGSAVSVSNVSKINHSQATSKVSSDSISKVSESKSSNVDLDFKKKPEKVVQKIIEKIDDDFQFIDEEKKAKKKQKKQKKQKKEKGQKSKSKDKKSKKKDVQSQSRIQNKTVEEQFQFI